MYGRMKWIISLLLICGSLAHADPADHDTRLTVLSGWTTASGSQMIGLRIDMAQGWKTYWRAPGDAGIPPQISWAGSTNIAGAAFHWPVPEVFYEGSARSIGYTDTVTIPMEVFPTQTGAAMQLSGQLDIGVCAEICVPVTLTFDMPLTPVTSRNPAIVAGLMNRPTTALEASLGTTTCAMSPLDGGMRITTVTTLPNVGTLSGIAIETSDPTVWVSEPKMQRSGRTLTATAELYQVDNKGFAIDRSGVRITLFADRQAIDIRGCIAP